MKTLTVAFALFTTMLASPLSAAPKDNTSATQLPVVGSTADGNVFTGVFSLQRFATNAEGKLVAVGLITGTATNPAGQVIAAGLKTVAIPVAVNTTGQAAAAIDAQAISCGILHLELGPLDLDLLGLQVHLNKVVLDITAVPGAGNLLGNLLCSVANLLNNPSGLAQLLNQILSILQGL